HPIPASVAVTCTDKIAQRTRLDEAGVPQPRWSTDAPPSYPCVVKAPDRQGQRAMTIVREPDGLDAAADHARRGSRSGRVLYEEFVPGPEVTVNAFSAGDRFVPVTVTDRIHFEGVPGVARRHVFPAAASGAAEAAGAASAAATTPRSAGRRRASTWRPRPCSPPSVSGSRPSRSNRSGTAPP